MHVLLLTRKLLQKHLNRFSWVQISSAGAQEQHDTKRTQLHSRQISLSGLSGGRLGSGGINIALKMSKLNPPRSNKSPPNQVRGAAGGEEASSAEVWKRLANVVYWVHPSIIHPPIWVGLLFVPPLIHYWSAVASELNPLLLFGGLKLQMLPDSPLIDADGQV